MPTQCAAVAAPRARACPCRSPPVPPAESEDQGDRRRSRARSGRRKRKDKRKRRREYKSNPFLELTPPFRLPYVPYGLPYPPPYDPPYGPPMPTPYVSGAPYFDYNMDAAAYAPFYYPSGPYTGPGNQTFGQCLATMDGDVVMDACNRDYNMVAMGMVGGGCQCASPRGNVGCGNTRDSVCGYEGPGALTLF